jgi:hypothetical protein
VVDTQDLHSFPAATTIKSNAQIQGNIEMTGEIHSSIYP